MYGISVWYQSVSQKSINMMNSLYVQYLKKYFGLPKFTNSSIIYYLSEEIPLGVRMKKIFESSKHTIELQLKTPINQNIFSNNEISTISPDDSQINERNKWYLENIKSIPTYFWKSKVVKVFPEKFDDRRKLCREITDLIHFERCNNKEFHLVQDINEQCVCKNCDEVMEHYHQDYGCHPFQRYPQFTLFS